MRLESLTIDKYRNVIPGTALKFGKGRTAVLGLNATGKTTLLTLLAKIVSGRGFEEEELKLGFVLRLNQAVLSVDVETISSDEPLEGDTRHSRRRRRGRHTVCAKFELRDAEGSIVVHCQPDSLDTKVRIDGAPLKLKRSRLPIRWGGLARMFLHACRVASQSLDAPDAEKFEQRILPTVAWAGRAECTRFDESLGFFSQIVGRHTSEMDASLPQWLEFVEPGGGNSMSVGRLFLDELGQKINASSQDDFVSIGVRDSPFLARLAAALGLAEAELRCELVEVVAVDALGEVSDADLDAEGGSTPGEYYFGNLSFWLSRKTGEKCTHDKLSFGEKRMLSFLYYLEQNEEVVVADELVNGMHHAWIREALDALGQRQAFLSSQNPLLIDELEFESAEDVASRIVICHLDNKGARKGQLAWKHPGVVDAQDIYAAYELGIEQTSEILRTRGYW